MAEEEKTQRGCVESLQAVVDSGIWSWEDGHREELRIVLRGLGMAKGSIDYWSNRALEAEETLKATLNQPAIEGNLRKCWKDSVDALSRSLGREQDLVVVIMGLREQLVECGKRVGEGGNGKMSGIITRSLEKTAEIARLKEVLKQARSALKPFAAMALRINKSSILVSNPPTWEVVGWEAICAAASAFSAIEMLGLGHD